MKFLILKYLSFQLLVTKQILVFPDFAADFRASTPTAAADMVVPDKKELEKKINNYSKNINIFINKELKINIPVYKASISLRIINPRK